ncbi:UDP-glucose 4-epimerase [Parageobacillus thermantarcticus]|uniref:UDP-glucose 4-epimerase n=1 Tax=Parageobacillus thermantarcticus TaxID=186116 RepID=A0A1I0TTN7_9BACL|nr:UDP-glucose 4-epimerase [Parageobacillus thermantarcticus]
MILVVGGAGYIGSHLVKELVEKEQVIVLITYRLAIAI